MGSNYFYPRRMCNDIIGKSRCKFLRERPAWLINDLVCVHPFAGECGMVITPEMNNGFGKVGCACYCGRENNGKRTVS